MANFDCTQNEQCEKCIFHTHVKVCGLVGIEINEYNMEEENSKKRWINFAIGIGMGFLLYKLIFDVLYTIIFK